jgi:outer membrane protein
MRRILTFAFGASLFAATAVAQTAPPPTQNPPPATPPAGTQKPTPPPLTVPPPTGTGTQTAKPPAPPTPFPADAKIAFVDLQRVVNDSKLGKAGLDQMKALNDKLSAAIQTKNKEIQTLQDKINTQRTVAAEAVLSGWMKDLDRQQRELQFMQQDAQVQVEQMQGELLSTFQQKVLPIVEAIRNERGLWMVFQLGETAAIVAAHQGLDLTAEVTKRLDSAK